MPLHPQPQLARDTYKILDQEWTLNGSPIQVPYPPESEASGFQGEIRNKKRKLVYETTFRIPHAWEGRRILIHFGAVDQLADVYLNDLFLSSHAGGYLHFTADAGYLSADVTHLLKLIVTDDLDPVYPYGKQTKAPGGMWYTEVSGIWQNVWVEAVPDRYITDLRITPDLSGVNLRLFRNHENGGAPQPNVLRIRSRGTEREMRFQGDRLRIDIAEVFRDIPGHPHLWTPEDPYLYHFTIETGEDRVSSYFALRIVEVRNRSGEEAPGIFLNGNRIFLRGVLDQGYFPEGIYTADAPENYAADIRRMKALGFNLLRKHIKVEPDAFYWYCDSIGMLVMQDLVNNGTYRYVRDTVLPTIGFHLMPQLSIWRTRLQQHISLKADLLQGDRNPAHSFFKRHMRDTLRQLYNHPSVIAYTIFNEGWGQFDSDGMYRLAKKLDPTRVYDATSGWFSGTESDFDSVHVYFRNIRLHPGFRPLLISEVGGYTYVPDADSAKPSPAGKSGRPQESASQDDSKQTYGYGSCSSSEDLADRIRNMYRSMIASAIPEGLAGFIYTQLSDVEGERNGLYTYDRKICKLPHGFRLP